MKEKSFTPTVYMEAFHTWNCQRAMCIPRMHTSCTPCMQIHTGNHRHVNIHLLKLRHHLSLRKTPDHKVVVRQNVRAFITSPLTESSSCS